jgi:hypothetical protein
MKRYSWAGVFLLVFAGLAVFYSNNNRTVLRGVKAAGPDAQHQFQDPNGGLAQYSLAIQSSTSAQATAQALSNWNAYVAARSGWGLSATNVSRLAAADWNKRSLGAPTITAQQIASATNKLIANQLATMTAAQQTALLTSSTVTATPKGRMGLNQNDEHVTAAKNANGTYTVTISDTAFSDRKNDFLTLGPGTMSSSANFYPSEAVLVAYSVATWDMGFGNATIAKVTQRIGDMSGLNMTGKKLYGDSGYMTRRPVSMFLTDAAMAQFFTDLGF